MRHQHEMDVWRTTKLAPGTILMPGVDQSCDEHRGASRTRRETPRRLGRHRRAGECRGRRRLRHGRTGTRRNRLGKARGAGRRRGPRDENLGWWLLNFRVRPPPAIPSGYNQPALLCLCAHFLDLAPAESRRCALGAVPEFQSRGRNSTSSDALPSPRTCGSVDAVSAPSGACSPAAPAAAPHSE